MNNKKQGFVYNRSASTNICLEVPADNNSFLTESVI